MVDNSEVKHWSPRLAEIFRRPFNRVLDTREWSWKRVRPVFRHAARLGLGIGAILLLDHGVHASLARHDGLRVDSPRFNWTDVDGVRPVMTESMDRALESVHTHATDDTLIPRIAATLEADPWIRKIHRLRRVYPNHLELDIQFRRHAVAVRHGDGYVLLDADGIRLPGRVATLPAGMETPAVVGVMMAPPAPGEIWDSRDIRVAYEMIRLRENSMLKTLPIVEMDLSNLGGRIHPFGCEIILRLSNGCEIQWGSPPSERKPHWEADVAGKLANLKRALELSPAADGRTIYISEPGKVVFVPEEQETP